MTPLITSDKLCGVPDNDLAVETHSIALADR